jgi:uncharacterized protein
MSRPSEKDLVILTGTVGSHSYGTATPTSDYDYMSFVIATPDVYLGLKNWGNSGTRDDEYDDPVKGHVEHKYFELKKAIGMCANFNPNIIPLLWLEDPCYDVMSSQGALLIKNRTIFNSRKMYHTFSGYAHGQLQAMGGVFNDNEESNKLLKKGYEQFQVFADNQIAIQRGHRDAKDLRPEYADFTVGTPFYRKESYDEGYLNAMIALRTHAKEECKRIKDGPITGRMGKKRKELREKYGYDVKFAFHTIRLMKMCLEFLRRPEEGLKVYRKGIDADELYSIREGKYTQEEIKKWADDLFSEAKEAVKTSPLPEEPDHESIHSLTMDLIRTTL